MRPAQPVLGVALIVGSVFLMSFGDAVIKYNSASFTAWQIFALRSTITVPVLGGSMVLLGPGEPLLPKRLRWVGPAQCPHGPDVDRLLRGAAA